MILRVIFSLVAGIAILVGGYVYTSSGDSPRVTQPTTVKVRPLSPATPQVDQSTREAIEGLKLRQSGD